VPQAKTRARDAGIAQCDEQSLDRLFDGLLPFGDGVAVALFFLVHHKTFTGQPIR
jgi:hypothetical protein